MMEADRFDRSVLHAFMFFDEIDELSALLNTHPGLDDYVVPAIALMQALAQLSIIDQARSIGPEGDVMELISMPDGSIATRMSSGSKMSASDHITDLFTAARECSDFLTREAWQLLGVLAEDQADEKLRDRLLFHREALGICLENGFDQSWYETQREQDLPDHGADDREWADTYSACYEMLTAQSPGELDALVGDHPWMRVYVEGIPIEFSNAQGAFRTGIAEFCFAGSWSAMRRVVKTTPSLVSSDGERLLVHIAEIASRNQDEQPEHNWVARMVNTRIELLRDLKTGEIDAKLIDNAQYWVM